MVGVIVAAAISRADADWSSQSRAGSPPPR